MKKTLKLIVGLFLFMPCLYTSGMSSKENQEHIIETSLSVPENWDKPGSRKITLPLKIYKSKSTTPAEPIIWLSGGPGMTNMDYVPPSELLENHDVVALGYRGVDGSVILDCPEIERAMLGKGNDVLSPESVHAFQSAVKRCATRLQGQENIDLDGFTLPQVLKDMEALRKHLNVEKINLLSASYGTRVAQMYAKHYPSSVHRIILIGASSPGGFVWEPETIHEKIMDYDQLCQKDPYCKSRTNNLGKSFEKALSAMPKRYWGTPLNPGKIKMVSFAMMYNTGSALKVIDAYLAAEKGDYSGLSLMSLSYDYLMPTLMCWGDFLAKGMIDYEPSRNYHEAFTNSPYPLGSPISAFIMDAGMLWPSQQPPKSFSVLDSIEAGILILNGDLDFSTPHEPIEEDVLPFLKNGKLVLFSGLGHVPDLLYKPEVKKGMAEYYHKGKVSFEERKYNVDFKVKYGFPFIAKALIIGLVFVSIVLLGIGYWMVKSLKKRRQKASKSKVI